MAEDGEDATVGDATPVTSAECELLAPDLYKHLLSEFFDVPPADRYGYGSRWVMNTGWLNEVRLLAQDKLNLAMHGEYLMGLPLEVRDDGGIPHLERD